MKVNLSANAYGKNAINLSKITRHSDHHEFRQISVDVSLKGRFQFAHTKGDNTNILPTDTQKNTVYALAKDHFTDSIESFALFLANYFFVQNEKVTEATVSIAEHLYQRLTFNGEVHPHAYVSSGNEKRFTRVVRDAAVASISSGIKDLLILKTTDSAFKGYIQDKFTTLKETDDRILATQCEATWTYNSNNINFDIVYAGVRLRLLQTFAFHKSLSVQQTMYAMGQDVLQENDSIERINLVMPNKHHITFNLEQFGMQNNNEIFMATDEPFGYITGTLERERE